MVRNLVALVVGSVVASGVAEAAMPLPELEVDGFPVRPVEQICGMVAVHAYAPPAATWSETWFALGVLDEGALRQRLCSTHDRQEVAVALQMLAASTEDDHLRAVAAYVYVDPLELALLGMEESFADADAGRRDLLAAAVLARRMADRTGDDVLLSMVGGLTPVSAAVAPSREVVEADRRYVDAMVARYDALYAAPVRR